MNTKIVLLLILFMLLFSFVIQTNAEATGQVDDSKYVLVKVAEDEPAGKLKVLGRQKEDIEKIEVEDGDTLKVYLKNDAPFEIRLRAIDAPEEYRKYDGRQQDYHQQSKKILVSIMEEIPVRDKEKTLTVYVVNNHETDAQGRTLAKVTYKDKGEKEIDIGLRLISEGAAWHFKRFKWEQSLEDRYCYAFAEKLARGNELDGKNKDYIKEKTEKEIAEEFNCVLPEQKRVGLWQYANDKKKKLGKEVSKRRREEGPIIEPPWYWRLRNLSRYESYNINPVMPTKKEQTDYAKQTGLDVSEVTLFVKGKDGDIEVDTKQISQESVQNVPTGGSWETAVLVGLTDAITELAEENMIDWFVNEVLEDLCSDKLTEYFEEICGLREANSEVTMMSKTVLRDTLKRDIDKLPAKLAAKLYHEDYQVTHWVYILGGLLNSARKGVPATYLVSGLADDPYVSMFCRDENRHACALLLSGAMMQAYMAIPYYENYNDKTHPKWWDWREKYLNKLEEKIRGDYNEVFGNCATEFTACYKLIQRVEALKNTIEPDLVPYFKMRKFVETISTETRALKKLGNGDASKNNLGAIYQKAYVIGENTVNLIKVVNEVFGSGLTCNDSFKPCDGQGIIADLQDDKFGRTMLAVAGFFSGKYSDGYSNLIKAIGEYERQLKEIRDTFLEGNNEKKLDTIVSMLSLENYPVDKLYELVKTTGHMAGNAHRACEHLDSQEEEKIKYLRCLRVKEVYKILRESCSKYVDARYNDSYEGSASDQGVKNLCVDFYDWDHEAKEGLGILRSRLPFLIDLASVSSSDQAKEVIKKAASPIGAWRLKRGTSMWSLGALAGFMAGKEKLSSGDGGGNIDGDSRVTGLFMPVGFDYSYSGKGAKDTYGLFISLLDLGGIASLRLDDNSDDATIESGSVIGFKQVVSPGLYFRYGWSDSPFVVGFGYSRTPKLRSAELKSTAENVELDSTRWIIFGAIDVPLFPIN